MRIGFAEEAAPFAPQPSALFLADACALVVFFSMAGQGMSGRGREAMIGRLAVSPVTVWEITKKMAAGKLPLLHGEDARDLVDFLDTRGYDFAPLTWEAAARANALPPHHKDPMDRLLIATALCSGMTIVTNDAVFAAYGVPTLW